MNDLKFEKKICIFFIHGFCSGSEDWDKQIEFFKSKFNVVAPTLRGHDGKNKSDMPMSIEQITDDCKKFVDEHKEKEFIFIGHSMGTRVAINLVYQFEKRTLGLILVDGSRFANAESYGKVITDFENSISKHDYILILKKMFASMFFNEKFKNDKKRIVERALKIPKKYSLPLRRNVIWFDAHYLENFLKKINIPILILHSTKLDKKRRRKPIKNNEKIDYIEFVKSSSSKVDVKVFKNTGHYISVEKPKLVNKTIFDWIKKIKI